METQKQADPAPSAEHWSEKGVRGLAFGLALHLLGHDTIDGLRGRRWTLVGICGPALAFIADVCTLFGSVAYWALLIFSTTLLALLVTIFFRPRYRRRCAFPCVVSLILIVSFGLILIAQTLAAAGNQGILAQQVPAIAEFQHQLGVIADNLGIVGIRTERIEAQNRRIEEKLDEFIQQMAAKVPLRTPLSLDKKQIDDAAKHSTMGASEAVVHSYLTGACQQAFNQIADSGGHAVQGISDLPNEIDNPDGSTKVSYTPRGLNVPAREADLCGFYVMPAKPQGNASNKSITPTVYKDVQTAFITMQRSARFAGKADVEKFIDPSSGGTWAGRMPTTPATSLEGIAADYFRVTGSVPKDRLPKTSPPKVEDPSSLPTGSDIQELFVTMARFRQWRASQ